MSVNILDAIMNIVKDPVINVKNIVTVEIEQIVWGLL